MKWYTCYYGNWNQPHGVQYVDESHNRKEIFAKAQETANKTGEVVTVSAEQGSYRGLEHEFYKFKPGADRPERMV